MATGHADQSAAGRGLSLCVFAIATDTSRFGTIRWSHALGRNTPEPGARCYNVFGSGAHNCRQCPARSRDESPTPRLLKVNGGYELVTARPLEPGIAQVWHLQLGERTVDRLLAARFGSLAEDAGLTPREEEVLELLMLGRSRSEIGFVLGISPRTVKFHEVNLLDKLGADSVKDLLRLVM